ncbi:MAG: adenosine kinase [Spirochaetota bacterium]
MISVLGIENPLIDIIMHADYSVFKDLNAAPGTMNLVERSTVDKILSTRTPSTILSGGSCSNTIRGLAWLIETSPSLEKPAFIGAVGDDQQGREYEKILIQHGVIPYLVKKCTQTGVSAIIVTPDHERTMFTYLGACRELSKEDVNDQVLKSAKYLHMTGYMWDTTNQEIVAHTSIKKARKKGIFISFDLADPFVVHRYGRKLKAWLPGKIDLLFANREELATITGITDGDETIIRTAGEISPLVVMKTGKDGCLILSDGVVERVPGEKVTPLDTTGAGDSFAAGFLYGLLTGKSPDRCGRLANRLASRIVTIDGCDYQKLDRNEILSR